MTLELLPLDLAADDVVGGAAPHLLAGDVLVVSTSLVPPVDAVLPSRVLRRRGDVVIVETAAGFVCRDTDAAAVPVDADRDARRIRDAVRGRAGVEVGVVLSARFDRPWRRGRMAVAVGCAGIAAIEGDVCVADELAAAAALLHTPAVIVRGVEPSWRREASVGREVVRPVGDELFR